jgi:putative glutamine amidotransferase
MAPRIGVTACAHLQDYLEAVRRAGGDPLVLETSDTPPEQVLDGIDGLLLTGGRDVDPAHFGEPRDAATEHAEHGRDVFEIGLVQAAVTRNVPLLGICRGMQVINVALGGSLVQDIPSMLPGAQPHDVAETPIVIAHDVWIAPDSRLWRALEERLTDEACAVNSRHHQAIRKVGRDLEVSATSPDGVIEAVERPASRFCVGVQWHPENFYRTGEFRPLFEAFIDACTAQPGSE